MQPPDAQDTHLPTTVILVGASVRAAAQSARRGGFSVLGADFFGDLDTLEVCDRHVLLHRDMPNESLRKLFANSPTAWNFPIIRVGGLGNEFQNDQANAFGPTLAETQALKDPSRLHQLARESGLQVPETILEPDSVYIPASPSCRWLKKNLHSSGGTGVAWHDGRPPEPFGRSVAASSTPAPPGFHLQRWIAGRNYGATFFADSDRVSLMGLFRSLFVHRATHPFLYAGSVGPIPWSTTSTVCKHLQRLVPAIHRFGKKIAQRFRLRGLFNVDFIVDRSGEGWVLEVNPRWTAASELVERRLNEIGAIGKTDSLMQWHILANVRSNTRVLPHDGDNLLGECDSRGPLWIKQVVYANRPGRLNVLDLQAISNRWSILFADLPPPTRTHQRGEPLVSMIGRLASNEDIGRVRTGNSPLSPSQWRRAIRETLAKMK